jgi:SAM-dependent methyltransferase
MPSATRDRRDISKPQSRKTKSMAETFNIDPKTVEGFGREWTTFTQERLSMSERMELFEKFFSLVTWTPKPKRALDMGCGSGRWALAVAPLVAELVAADASYEALEVAKRNVRAGNVSFVQATPDRLPFPNCHFDLIFSIGVLHHVPDTEGAIRSLASKLCSGGTLLLYLYYAFDNRPRWFKLLWRVSDWGRRVISRLPFALRYGLSQIAAVCVYWPLARIARYVPVPDSWPLKFYATRSFYFMRTDALDRFGTRLEKRFSRKQIVAMLESAELTEIQFSNSDPYWVCKAIKP